MDIKSAPIDSSAPSAPAGASAPKENLNPAFSATDGLPQFLIRTMKQDLAAAGGEPKIKTPEIKKETIEKKEIKDQERKEEKLRIVQAQKQRQKELNQILETAQLKLEKGGWAEVREELQKIIKAPEANWWLKWRAKSLFKKAEAKLKKPPAAKIAAPVKPAPPLPKPEIKIPEKPKIESVKPMATPAPSFQPPRVTAAPPVGLPIVETPVAPAPQPISQPKPEIKMPAPILPPKPLTPTPPAASIPPQIVPKPVFQPKPEIEVLMAIPPQIPPQPVAPLITPFLPARPPVKPLVPLGAPPLKKPATRPFPAKLVWGILAVLLICLASIIIYYSFTPPSPPQLTPTPLPSPLPSAAPTPQVAPAPLFEMEEKVTLEFATEAKNLFNVLQNSKILDKVPDSFTQIYIKKNDGSGQLMDFSETVASFFPGFLNLETVSTSLENIFDNNNFTLFAFWTKQENTSPFNPVSSQPRVGLVIKLADINAIQKTELQNILKNSESSLPALFQNFLPQTTFTDSSAVFSENIYQNTILRYFNFLPDASLSIDYTIGNDFFLITTSRSSAYSALDRILAK